MSTTPTIVWRFTLFNLNTKEVISIFADEPHKCIEKKQEIGLGQEWQPVVPLVCEDWTPDHDGKLIVYDRDRSPAFVRL